jgi:Uma2 family endonuclease
MNGQNMPALMPRATVDDLYRTDGQAELIGGMIVCFPPFGYKAGCIVGEIVSSLYDHAQKTGQGEVGTATLGYVIPELPSGRESFCADASYYLGPLPANPMHFIEGPPTFAVEVRSENAYKRSAEIDIDAKSADYFAAGTLVVWDVDPIAETIACYRAGAPTNPVTFRRGQTADAEPAVPGWRMPVDEIFA